MKPRRNIQYIPASEEDDDKRITICPSFVHVKSTKNININEELLLDYGDDFFSRDTTSCNACYQAHSNRGNEILLCDRPLCSNSFHQRCLQPPLSTIPKGKWYCPQCSQSMSQPNCDDQKEKKRTRAKALFQKDRDDEWTMQPKMKRVRFADTLELENETVTIN
jgi:hypothetical protein